MLWIRFFQGEHTAFARYWAGKYLLIGFTALTVHYYFKYNAHVSNIYNYESIQVQFHLNIALSTFFPRIGPAPRAGRSILDAKLFILEIPAFPWFLTRPNLVTMRIMDLRMPQSSFTLSREIAVVLGCRCTGKKNIEM